MGPLNDPTGIAEQTKIILTTFMAVLIFLHTSSFVDDGNAFSKNDEIRPINLLQHFPEAVHQWRGENGQNALHEAVMRDWQNLACRLVERSDFSDLMYHKDWSNATPLITAFKRKKHGHS
jgi:hypothetical protein